MLACELVVGLDGVLLLACAEERDCSGEVVDSVADLTSSGDAPVGICIASRGRFASDAMLLTREACG